MHYLRRGSITAVQNYAIISTHGLVCIFSTHAHTGPKVYEDENLVESDRSDPVERLTDN